MKIVAPTERDDRLAEATAAADLADVQKIVEEVRLKGDRAVREYTLRFDGVEIDELRVSQEEMESALDQAKLEDISALEKAAQLIARFAERQQEQLESFEYEIEPGVFAGQKVVPIERVGVYAPSGQHPLPSTVLMCTVPARVAGVQEIALCSPPSCQGTIHPTILVAARIAGVTEVYRMGGAQAIAALAHGTETVAGVDMVVGPGNRYVAEAKRLVFGVVGIDFVAGPSEILVLADGTASPNLVAADLLAQAEHDPDAVCVLVTTSWHLAKRVEAEIEKQSAAFDTAETIDRSLEANGLIVVMGSLEEAVEFANRRAPEHLHLQIAEPRRLIDELTNYGSLFIGSGAAVALGDYSSGVNHTLPTNRSARYTGGLSVMDFLKVQTTLRVDREGLAAIGPVALRLARIEGLPAHARSVELRMRS